MPCVVMDEDFKISKVGMFTPVHWSKWVMYWFHEFFKYFYFFLVVIHNVLILITGECMKQMADYKYALDDNVKQNYLEPMHHTQTKDLR